MAYDSVHDAFFENLLGGLQIKDLQVKSVAHCLRPGFHRTSGHPPLKPCPIQSLSRTSGTVRNFADPGLIGRALCLQNVWSQH